MILPIQCFARGFRSVFQPLCVEEFIHHFVGKRFAEDERTQTKDVGIVGKASAPGGELAFAYGRRYAAVEVCDDGAYGQRINVSVSRSLPRRYPSYS